jgi:hypothetical protein
MKNLIITLAIFLLFAVGCTDQTNINSPEQSIQTQEPNWLTLPQADGLGIEQTFSASKSISGDDGGYILINKSYKASTGATVSIYSKISFYEDAFIGTKYITMLVDDATCTVTFSPSMVFDISAVYNVTYTGVNLSNINPYTVKFAYIANDGSVQYAQHDGITVNVTTGTLSVKNARIPHFSRYGFVN